MITSVLVAETPPLVTVITAVPTAFPEIYRLDPLIAALAMLGLLELAVNVAPALVTAGHASIRSTGNRRV